MFVWICLHFILFPNIAYAPVAAALKATGRGGEAGIPRRDAGETFLQAERR